MKYHIQFNNIQQNDSNPHVCSFVHRDVEMFLNTEVSKSFLNLLGLVLLEFDVERIVVFQSWGFHESQAKTFAGFPGKLPKKIASDPYEKRRFLNRTCFQTVIFSCNK